MSDKKPCYICGNEKTVEWYSLWYDGKMRKICCQICRNRLEELCDQNQEKTYAYQVEQNRLLREKKNLDDKQECDTRGVICNCCGRKFDIYEEPGAIFIGSPTQVDTPYMNPPKAHLCQKCEKNIIEQWKYKPK